MLSRPPKVSVAIYLSGFSLIGVLFISATDSRNTALPALPVLIAARPIVRQRFPAELNFARLAVWTTFAIQFLTNDHS